MCQSCGHQHCEQESAQPHASTVQTEVVEDAGQVQRSAQSPQARQTALLQMQRQQGNRAVLRLIEGSAPIGQVQPWRVNIPADTPCHEVPDLITQTSPYSPKWANAHFDFRFRSTFIASGTAPTFTLRPSNLTVTVNPNIDVPQWSPTNRTTRTEWQSAMTALNAHENIHRTTANTWRGTIETALRAFRPTVTAATPRDAEDQGESVFQGEMDNQTALHQAAQDAVDANGANCVAIMNCPLPPTPTPQP